MLKQFYLSKRRNASSKDWIYLNPIINGKDIQFSIKKGETNIDGWNQHCNVTCPCCGNVTAAANIKKQFCEKETGLKLIAVIKEKEGIRQFEVPTDREIQLAEIVDEIKGKPLELLPPNDSQNLKVPLWGYKSFGELFSNRQLFVLLTLVEELNKIKQNMGQSDYDAAVITYLAILLDKVIARNSSFGI